MNGDRDKFARAPRAAVNGASKFQTFEKWLLDNGTKVPKLELRDYGNEVRGCHAVGEISEDEIIVEVPLKCLITVEMGKETSIGRAILSANLDLDAPKHIFLMVYMLMDMKNTSSFFKPYYDILPPTLSNMPIFWTPDELGYLEGSYLLQQIEERSQAIEADYAAICSVAPQFASVSTLEEFKWARMCVCSRNFGLIVNGVRTAALVPYADMLNHYRPRETKWQFEDATQSFTIVSLQGIHGGAQVYDSYGQKCNHRFLLNYGFSVENNVETDGFCPNEVPLLLQLHRADPLLEQKLAYWRRDSSLPARRVRVSISDNDNTRIMLAMLRIVEADQNDFDILTAACNNVNNLTANTNTTSTSPAAYRSIRDAQTPVGLLNETRAMQHLQALCGEYLSHYKTSFEEDCRRLATPGAVAPFSNERHALIQVRGEKEVLLFFKEFADTALRLLQKRDQRDFDAAMEDVINNKHPLLQQYASGVVLRLRQEEQRRLDARQKSLDFSRPTVV